MAHMLVEEIYAWEKKLRACYQAFVNKGVRL